MNITLDLSDDLMEHLQVGAELSGLSLEEHTQKLLQRLVLPLKADSETEVEWSEIEIALNEALRILKEKQIENREHVVHVITQKNNLESNVHRTAWQIEEMERKAVKALEEGNAGLAEKFRSEKALMAKALEDFRDCLAPAEEAAERVKQFVRKEEDIRRRTVEALVIQTRIRASRVVHLAANTEPGNPPKTSSDDGTQWKAAYDAWMGGLSEDTKAALRKRVRGILRKRRLASVATKLRKGRRD